MHAYYANLDCTNGSIRLVGGSNKYEGSVEVCVNNNWRTVCYNSNYWDAADAHVVCRQLGFSIKNSVALNTYHSGQGNLFGVVRNVICDGQELSFFNCKYTIYGGYYCYNRASVRCGELRSQM